ncbi:hypothetical protein [Lactobacillus sp. MRS-253-APC-2B]|nr:hypothetical protein [Lactobacillus sp. MRS-253-APC-2B]
MRQIVLPIKNDEVLKQVQDTLLNPHWLRNQMALSHVSRGIN